MSIVTVRGQVGPQVLADGAEQAFRLGKTGEQVITELHGRYYEQASRGGIFQAASQAGATTTVGLATTYTGLCLSNPINSPVNLVLLKASVMQSVIQATQPEAFALAYGYSASTNVTHTAAVAPQPTRIGSGVTPTAKADSSATLPTAPVYGTFVTATTSATTDASGVIDLEGAVILLPGAYAIWATPAQASVAGMWFSFMWEEVAV